MPEPINAKNRDLATQSLLRAALFYRGIVNAVTERRQDVIAEIMSEGEGDERWNAAEAADTAIKEWSDFLEIREDSTEAALCGIAPARHPSPHPEGSAVAVILADTSASAADNAAASASEPENVAEVVLRGGGDLRSLLVAMIDQSDMNRAEISEYTGLSEARLSRSYNGKTVTTIETLVVVASVLGHRVAVRIEK